MLCSCDESFKQNKYLNTYICGTEETFSGNSEATLNVHLDLQHNKIYTKMSELYLMCYYYNTTLEFH